MNIAQHLHMEAAKFCASPLRMYVHVYGWMKACIWMDEGMYMDGWRHACVYVCDCVRVCMDVLCVHVCLFICMAVFRLGLSACIYLWLSGCLSICHNYGQLPTPEVLVLHALSCWHWQSGLLRQNQIEGARWHETVKRGEIFPSARFVWLFYQYLYKRSTPLLRIATPQGSRRACSNESVAAWYSHGINTSLILFMSALSFQLLSCPLPAAKEAPQSTAANVVNYSICHCASAVGYDMHHNS